jgi:tRNA dimethylallyltransferase
MKKGKLIVLVGETASGKSGLAINIAKKYNGEVISADSRAVFRGMDVGTAKPSMKEREGIIHHGFDLVDPTEKYSAAQFKVYAQSTIKDIVSRGKVPILVGGTGLYVDGVLFDYSFGEETSSDLRSELNNKSVDELATILLKKGITPDSQVLKNKRHLVRLVERDGQTENNKTIQYNALIIGVTISRTQLRKRIEERVELMFKNGLRKEYNELRQKYPINSEAFTGIGYREFVEAEGSDTSTSEVKRHIVKNTINLAKRQRTWFKRNRLIRWVESPEDALRLVDEFIG